MWNLYIIHLCCLHDFGKCSFPYFMPKNRCADCANPTKRSVLLLHRKAFFPVSIPRSNTHSLVVRIYHNFNFCVWVRLRRNSRPASSRQMTGKGHKVLAWKEGAFLWSLIYRPAIKSGCFSCCFHCLRVAKTVHGWYFSLPRWSNVTPGQLKKTFQQRKFWEILVYAPLNRAN